MTPRPSDRLRLLAAGLVALAWVTWVAIRFRGALPGLSLLAGPAAGLALVFLESERAAPLRRLWARPGLQARLAWCAAAAAHLAVGVPWLPAMPDAELDPSWQLALHHAALEGWRFGTDVVFSFGPLGLVYTDMFAPATFGLLLCARAAWALLTATLVWSLGRAAGAAPWRAAAWSSALALLTSFDTDSRFYALVVAFLLARHAAPRAVLLATSAVLAAALLMKFSVGVAAAAALGLVAIEDLSRRRLPASGLVGCAALALSWCVCRQPPAGLLGYLRSSLEVTAGYGEAMSVTSNAWFDSTFELAGLWSCAALLAWRLGLPGDRRQGAFTALGLLGLSALVAKASVVRQDQGHVLLGLATYGTTIGLLAAPALGAAAPRADARSARRPALACVLLAALLLASGLARCAYQDPLLLVGRACLDAPARPLVGLWAWATGELDAAREEALDRIRRDHPVGARATGRVDVFPHGVAIALAHGLDYAHRPILQSYAAFTPSLLRMNVEWLRGPLAPDSVLLGVEPIDGRLATQEDGPCWPELRARYDVAGVDSATLLLARREVLRAARLEPLADLEVGFDAPIDLPPADVVWATVDVRLTAAGRALLAVYKLPTVSLVLTDADGAVWTLRLVRATGPEGFVLSPWIRTVDDAEAFLRGRPAGRARPVKLALRLNGPAALTGRVFEPTARVTLARLAVE